MNRFLCALLLVATTSASAEVICALGPATASYDPKMDQRPSADVMQMAKRLNTALSFSCSPKCPQIAILRNTTAPNAMLVVTPDQAKLVYAPQFFASVYDKYGDAAILAIITHEYAHALDEVYPAAWMSKTWSAELRADGWAGCALAKSNFSAKSLGEALTAVSKYPPLSHPAWTSRSAALRLGYVHCGGDGAKFDQAPRQ
jgi:hypothetical protein